MDNAREIVKDAPVMPERSRLLAGFLTPAEPGTHRGQPDGDRRQG